MIALSAGISCYPFPGSPRDLIDINALRSLSLGELGWQQVSEEQLPSGAVLTVGTFYTVDANGTPQTIELQEHAAIYWPPDYPSTPNSLAGFGHVHAAHVKSGILSDTAERLALGFGLAPEPRQGNSHCSGCLLPSAPSRLFPASHRCRKDTAIRSLSISSPRRRRGPRGQSRGHAGEKGVATAVPERLSRFSGTAPERSTAVPS